MQRIEKKHLRKMNCPKCARPKLRFEHGVAPGDGTGPQLNLRCDQCRLQFVESDPAIQLELSKVLGSVTPTPVVAHR